MKKLSQETYGVMVGRFCPIHNGHEEMINQMISDNSVDNSLIIVGSSNKPISFRNIFSLQERVSFLKKIFPDCPIVGLPDFQTNAEWISCLNDLLIFGGIDPENVIFYGGCEEDMSVLVRFGKKIKVINRFDGTTQKISATELRDALLHDRDVNGMVNEKVSEEIKSTFKKNWEVLKNS